VEQEEVGDVTRGDVPLLAGDDPIGVVALRRRFDHRGIGAGVLLGDRVGITPLASTSRTQEPFLLLLRAGGERDGRPPRDVPERSGGVAPLLLDQHLSEQVVAAAAVRLGVVDRMEVPVEDGLLRRRGALRRQAAIRFALVLERNEHLVSEVARPLLELAIDLRKSHVHGAEV